MLTQAQYQTATEELAKSIEAPLIAAVDAQRDAILDSLGIFTRFVAARMWAAVLAMVPILARVALAAILDRFGSTTIAALADLLYAHKEQAAARESKHETTNAIRPEP